jgi:uncharacterized protein
LSETPIKIELPPEPDVAPPPRPDPPWSGWDVAAIVVVTLFSIFSASLLVIGFVMQLPAWQGAQSHELTKDARILLAAQTLAYICVVFVMYLLARFRYERSLSDAVRWNWQRAQAHWPAFALGGVILALGVQIAARYLPIPKSLPIEELFRDATSAWWLAAFGITVAPLVEELFYRGFLYPVLERHTGVVGAVLLTSVPFALMHAAQLAASWAPLLVLFSVSVVLTAARALTGSVAVPFLLHAAYNATLFATVYFATDGFRNLERLQH